MYKRDFIETPMTRIEADFNREIKNALRDISIFYCAIKQKSRLIAETGCVYACGLSIMLPAIVHIGLLLIDLVIFIVSTDDGFYQTVTYHIFFIQFNMTNAIDVL